MSSYIEIFTDQNSNSNTVLTLSITAANTNLNMTGANVYSNARNSPFTQNVAFSFICTVLDGANNIVSLSLVPANTANLNLLLTNRFVFDVKCVMPDGITTHPAQGIVIVNPAITP